MLQISTRMTGGYFSKVSEIPPQDPSKPIGDECHFPIIADLVRYILFNPALDAKDRARCAKTCRTFRRILHSKEQYFKWQFMARLNVLKGHRFREQGLVSRMQAIVDNPDTDYSKFKLPREFSVVRHLAGQLFKSSQKEHKDLDNILEECQRRIELTYANPTFHCMNENFIKVIVEDKNNEYELRAYHDTLYPLAKLVTDRAAEYHRFMPYNDDATKYSLPVYLSIAEALFRETDKKHLKLGCMIEQVTCPDDLKGLNHLLPHAKHLEMLEISMDHMGWKSGDVPYNNFSWTAGQGLAALKEGIIHVPKLRILQFNQFLPNYVIDEKNALAIADMVISRQRLTGKKPFEEIRFGLNCITQTAAQTLVEALKDYPVPIVVFFTVIGFFQLPFAQEEMKKAGKMVNIRWDGDCPSSIKMNEGCWILEGNNTITRQRLEEIKMIEAKRNKG